MPDRLNEEPVVFLSMTNSELKLAVVSVLLLWFPVCLTVGVLLSKTLLSLAAVLALSYVTLYLAGKQLRVIKRGKPRQYHVMAISAWLEDKGLKMKTMIRESKTWDIKRTHTRPLGNKA